VADADQIRRHCGNASALGADGFRQAKDDCGSGCSPAPEERARLERGEGLHYNEPMKNDANDGKHWSEMDVRSLMASLRCGDTIEETAERLCRSGTVDEVRRKAEELGLRYKSRGR
jgi:hypothetical protein